jgi:hypothetical protein
MPTVLEHLGLKYKINANDHNPPHAHIEGRGGSVRVDLRSFDVMSANGFSQKDINRIVNIVKLYREQLMEVWDEYHE